MKLVVYDDASTASGNQSAAQLLIQKGVLGVIDDTSFAFGGAAALSKANIPVTGASIDGPEWGASKNMFSVTPPTETPVDGRMYTYTDLVNVFKALGIKKLAQVGYEIPSVTQAANQTFQLAAAAGISKCYNNNTISFGANDFTAVILAIKSAGCDGVYVPMLLTSEIAIAQGLKNAGSTAKLVSPSVAYDPNVLSSPASLNALAGDYTAASVDLNQPEPWFADDARQPQEIRELLESGSEPQHRLGLSRRRRPDQRHPDGGVQPDSEQRHHRHTDDHQL